MPGESLAQLLPAALRVALELPVVGTGVGSDASGGLERFGGSGGGGRR